MDQHKQTTGGNMQIQIKKNAYVYAGASTEMREFLRTHEGKWLQVETDHLFTNQYNTKKWRIMDSMVAAVRRDARIGMGKCKYCGTMVKTGKTCTKHADCATYGIEWFTEKNTYFLRYPNGYDHKAVEILSISVPNIKIGTYYLESFPSLGYYRLYNCRQTINFRYQDGKFWVHNGIGLTQKFPTVPGWVIVKVQKKIKELEAQ